MNTMNTNFIKALAMIQSLETDLRHRAKEERGAVMAEYGLLLAVIALAIIATLVLFRDELASTFSRSVTALNTGASA